MLFGSFGTEVIAPSLSLAHGAEMDGRSWCCFESDRLPIPGHQLQQQQVITSIDGIHDELIALRRPRWQSLTQVPADAWQRIVDFTTAFVPVPALAHQSLSLPLMRSAFRSKGALKTGGPDGWRKEDVLALPDSALQDVLGLFQGIEAGWQWPRQLTRGHVFCLQKARNRFDVANFRPVVLFSIWYRLWGVIRARHYLAEMETFACFPAFGFLRSRGCLDLIYVVQSAIEVALRTGDGLCGLLADLEKCFNLIPREPIVFLARWFGIDHGVITGWTSFLTLAHRAFMVRNHPSPPVFSDTGLPEGDSMSCLGMVLLNFSFHFYMAHFQPLNELSYVDNLEVLSHDPGGLAAGLVTLQSWVDMFRLRLDRQKSMTWAIRLQDRHALPQLGLPVVTSAKDLGASMCYSAKLLNKPLQDRIQGVAPFWRKLRHMRVSPWHKISAIKMALLPRALYASALTSLGEVWFTRLCGSTVLALTQFYASA